jgi:hypothetical protein
MRRHHHRQENAEDHERLPPHVRQREDKGQKRAEDQRKGRRDRRAVEAVEQRAADGAGVQRLEKGRKSGAGRAP